MLICVTKYRLKYIMKWKKVFINFFPTWDTNFNFSLLNYDYLLLVHIYLLSISLNLSRRNALTFREKCNCYRWFTANIYLIKVNSRNTRKRWKLTIKTPDRLHWCRSGVFIINFEHISHLFLVFLLLTLNK